MLQRIYKIGLACLLFGGGLWLGSMFTADAADPDSPGGINDPLVTKSYVDEKIAAMVKDEVSKVSGGGAELEVVQLTAGKVLFGGKGAEMIVRNGSTVAVSNSSNGIPDVTAGKDILNGAAVPNNHLLIFPGEGRGIKPASGTQGTIFVMVRGNYLLLDAQ